MLHITCKQTRGLTYNSIVRAATTCRSPPHHRQINAIHVTRPNGITWTVGNMRQTNQLVAGFHGAETSVAVDPTVQNYLIATVHRAEAPVAARSNQQSH